jgi:hypothetical protein
VVDAVGLVHVLGYLRAVTGHVDQCASDVAMVASSVTVVHTCVGMCSDAVVVVDVMRVSAVSACCCGLGVCCDTV